MNRTFRTSFLLATVIATVWADPAADADWQALQSLLAPVVRDQDKPEKKGAEEAAANLQRAAEKAGEFQAKFPADSRLGAARKLEVTAALQAVQLGATEREAALARAEAYRKDKAHAAADRLDVALTVELMTASANRPGHNPRADGPSYEKIVDRLHGEFGDLDEVFKLYFTVARTSDSATAARIARKLLKLPIPTWAKVQAQALSDREDLLHRPVDLEITSVSGEKIDLKSATKQPVVLIFWDASAGTAGLAPLATIKSEVPASAKWLYLGIGDKSLAIADAQAQAPIPGTHCLLDQGLRSRLARTLKVQHLPCAYVIDGQGKLSGFGALVDLPGLLKTAGR